MPGGRFRHRVVLPTIEIEDAIVEDTPETTSELGPKTGEEVGPHLVHDDQDRERGLVTRRGGDRPGRGGLEEGEEYREHSEV